MRYMLKVLLVISLTFAATFLVMKSMGWLSVEQVTGWLALASKLSPLTLSAIVIALLFLDLFIAMPTLTIIILAGYFLGYPLAAIVVFVGILLAALSGYFLSFYCGERLLRALLKDECKRCQAIAAFNANGAAMIILARAMPILPEATACMAGISKMRFSRFIGYWLIGAVPYTLIATYAGSISSYTNPKPALLIGLVLPFSLWLCWCGYFHLKRRAVRYKQRDQKAL